MNDDVAEGFEGVALHERLGLTWTAGELDNTIELDHVNQETNRVLQAMAVFEEAPREVASDASQPGHELQHLEAKTDVLLSLVGMLIAERQSAVTEHSMVLRAASIEWAGPAGEGLARGDTGYLQIYANPMLPLPIRLPARIVGTTERNGTRWLLTRFENLVPAVANGMEKLVFRRHRRQVALSRGTGVHSQTGVFQMPKK
ncbi:MAG: PilZ domain-containing protein [Gammaproteobacteria bacterium]|nr:PilZ domain-containing protein [Gammaproteobacteria bacterium]